MVVIGRGAAGTAAATTLSKYDFDGRVVILRKTDVLAYNRTLVNKGLLPGLLTDEQAALPPIDGVEEIADTATDLDQARREIHLGNGGTIGFDAAILATGSTPRLLEAGMSGSATAAASGRFYPLHSARDAHHIRTRIAAEPGRTATVAILGAGLIGAETSSILTDIGVHVALVARSHTPLGALLGEPIAERVTDGHREHVATYFGREITAVGADESAVTVDLDGGDRVRADLVICAHGTNPDA